MVWQASRNFSPSVFIPRTFTGIRVNTRELRRLLSFSVRGIMNLSCNIASSESTDSASGFPLAATSSLPYNVRSFPPNLHRHTIHSLRRALRVIMLIHMFGRTDELSRLHRKPARGKSQRAEGVPSHPQRQHQERAQAGYRTRRPLGR